MPENPPEKLETYFHKSNFFRVVHSDGCFGGLSPRGLINCAFYSERFAIPLRTSIPVMDGKVVGAEEVLESKSGVVRELEVEVIMDLSTATSFFIWFRDKLEELRKIANVPDAEWEKVMKGGGK